MNRLKLWITALGISGMLSIGSLAQDSGAKLETPGSVSASAGESQRLSPPQVFTFQLRFDQAPDGYGGGQISYRFALVESGPMGSYARKSQRVIEGQTDLHDGQAIYTFSFPIGEAMVPGRYRLVSVRLGRAVVNEVPIKNNVTFEIPGLPPVFMHTEAPAATVAGHKFVFKVTVDQFPTGMEPYCAPMIYADLVQFSGVGQSNRNEPILRLSPIKLERETRVYEMSGVFLPDSPSGTWHGRVSLLGQVVDPRFRDDPCTFPPVEGNTIFSFTVEPSPGLVTPTSVGVTANPSQIDLLVGEADRLRATAQHLKDKLDSENVAANRDLLRDTLQKADAALDKTEDTFKQRGTDQSSIRVVNAFFDDIRYDYGEALKALANDSAGIYSPSPRLLLVGEAVGSSPHLTLATTAALNSILHNVRAYDVVATSTTLTFSLEVYSDPDGATISYRQRNQEYHFVDHETDWRIENLPRGVYFIRVQKSGYEDNEKQFDAMDNTSTSIKIPMKRKRGAR
jgi:hypothetical protein